MKEKLILLFSLPFIIIGIWMISSEQKGTSNYYMGWYCLSFFSIGIPIGIFTLFDKRPQIIINENGIWDRTLKQNEIKWERYLLL
ncbi:MAG: STM3941 family protein [Flavobacterium sp.]